MRGKSSIPQSVRNLELNSRESSRGSTIASPLVLKIQRDLRSIEPRGFDAVQFQVSDRLGYNPTCHIGIDLLGGETPPSELLEAVLAFSRELDPSVHLTLFGTPE